MSIFWPAFLLGFMVIGAGVLLFRGASRIAPRLRNMQASDFSRRSITDRNIRIAAVGWVVVGSIMIVASLLNLDW